MKRDHLDFRLRNYSINNSNVPIFYVEKIAKYYDFGVIRGYHSWRSKYLFYKLMFWRSRSFKDLPRVLIVYSSIGELIKSYRSDPKKKVFE